MIAQVPTHTQLNTPILPVLTPDLDRIYANMQEEITLRQKVEAENSILLSEKYALLDELAEKDETIERLYATIHRHEQKWDWMRNLFSNKKIPTACKLVLWQYFMIVSFMRPNLSDELQIRMDNVAANLGIDSATVRRATDKAEKANILTRRYETIEQDGETRKFVHITLGDIVAHPEYIAMEKTHGGQRVRRCPNHECQSEDVDRYTVQFCRACQELAWYGQPGLRTDADVRLAQKASRHHSHPTIAREEAAAPDDASEKQDAFAPDPVIEVSNRIENAIDQADRKMKNISRQAPEKQDAFEQPAQLVAKHPYKDSGKLQDAFQVWGNVELKTPVCHAQIPLNKDGQPAKACNEHGHADKVVSYRECGSTAQRWSDAYQSRMCAECWTPQQSQEGK